MSKNELEKSTDIVESKSKTEVNISIVDESNRPGTKSFVFDQVCLPNSTQEHVFRSSGVTSIIDSAIDGYATTIFAYVFNYCF